MSVAACRVAWRGLAWPGLAWLGLAWLGQSVPGSDHKACSDHKDRVRDVLLARDRVHIVEANGRPIYNESGGDGFLKAA
jgi:hypothetical protein